MKLTTLKEEEAKRAAELIIASKELVFQKEEKAKRASELVIADRELVFQKEEKAKLASELVIANRELVSQQGINKEKETLINETRHRIKNNIATIQSLLSMQLKSISNPEAISILKDTIARLFSIQVLYDKLIINNDYINLSVKDYIENLIDSIVSLFQYNSLITIEKQIDKFFLPSKRLFTLGIIFNELLTNHLKHSFNGRESCIIKIIISNINNQVTLSMQDNGKGLPKDFTVSKAKGLGLSLVTLLAEELDGVFSIEDNEGVRSTLKFNI